LKGKKEGRKGRRRQPRRKLDYGMREIAAARASKSSKSMGKTAEEWKKLRERILQKGREGGNWLKE
jgi:hypothetical protein